MIGIVTNPNALGLVRDRTLASRLGEIVGSDGVVLETHTPGELRQAVLEFRRLEADVIGICGGDGTNLSVLSEAVTHYPPDALPRFAILRGGTVNTVANNLHIGGHAEEILERLVARYRAGTPIPSVSRDLLGAHGLHGFLMGAGMPGRFFEAYYGGPVTGVAWAAVLATRIVGSAFVGGDFARWIFDPIEAEITADGRRLPLDRYTLVIAATLANVGLGFKPTYRGGSVPGQFHLLATGLSPARLASNSLRCLRGKPLAGQPHFDLLAREAHLRFARPQTYTFDGDLFRGTEVTLTAGPRITILTP